MLIPPLEWDEAKRQRTLTERGVDFAAFGVFWDGRPFVEEPDPRHAAEPRSLRFARIEGRLFIVVWTPRDGAVRIISARKANRCVFRRCRSVVSVEGDHAVRSKPIRRFARSRSPRSGLRRRVSRDG